MIDRDEEIVEVVDQNGLIVSNDDEEQLKEYIKSAISVENLIETFDDNAHQALLKLLALQNNNSPLKKGGINIAYRTDVLIMNCKMDLSADENIVFDAILGVVSSYPEYDTYKIKASDFLAYSRYKNPKQIYEAFNNGANSLSERSLNFLKLGSEKKNPLKVAWFKALHYHSRSKDDADAYIYFKPSEFFKALALAAKVVHGAYGRIEVTTQLKSKYTIVFYWLLESKKNYKSYRGATPGDFEMTVEEVRFHFDIPDTYKAGDIKRRVFEDSLCINDIEECDLTFSYDTLTEGKKIIGFNIHVREKKTIAESNNVPQIEDASYSQLKMFIQASALDFTEVEIVKIYQKMQDLKKDLPYVMQAIMTFKQRLEDPNQDVIAKDARVSYLCKMIENGFITMTPDTKRRTNRFNNFPQNSNQDFVALEKQLLDN